MRCTRTTPLTTTSADQRYGLGHPGDAWGWVVGAGLRLNFPMVAQGDYFQGEVNYTQGALRYLNQPTQGNYETRYGNKRIVRHHVGLRVRLLDRHWWR